MTGTDRPRPPTQVELDAFRLGRLDPARFEAVDRWLAQLPPDEQERVLGTGAPVGGQLAAMAQDLDPAVEPPFVPELSRRRFEGGQDLGGGGMGVVSLLRDARLERDVAIKRLRPRQPQESLEDYQTRLHAFAREAAITARLEHPSIVPVHDIGEGPLHEPAFVMKRLDGAPASDLVSRRLAGGRLDAGQVATLVLKVAEALGYAHARGIVHRDLKPEHIIVGQHGAVSVIDWGMAAEVGAAHAAFRVGTPLWMAPEQATSADADPRQDVFALGGVLMALLTGHPPRREGSGQLDLGALDAAKLPAGLVAVARRCLREDPAERYADGDEVAADLQRWLSDGISHAQEPSAYARASAWIRRSPRLLAALATAVAVGALWFAWGTWEEHERRMADAKRVAVLADQVPLHELSAVRAALGEVGSILSAHPDLRSAIDLRARLQTALEAQERQRLEAGIRDHLAELERRYRVSGPWPSQVDDLIGAVRATGLELGVDSIERDVAHLRGHDLRDDVMVALVRLQQARLGAGSGAAESDIPSLIRQAAWSPGWEALGRLLDQPRMQGHDLVFCDCPDSEAALRDPGTTEVLLSLYGPEPRLVDLARTRLATDPGSFWARVILGRSCVQRTSWPEANEHALVAIGAEPRSLWPHLILAYVAMAQGDQRRFMDAVDAGLAANPAHVELQVLKAVVLARAGRVSEAQAIVDRLDASHLQYHLQTPTGHHMDQGVAALAAAGLRIPVAPPVIGPLTPHQH